MFQGTFEHAIDAKGRVNVPVEFRDVLRTIGDERVIVTNFPFGGVRCLDAYPPGAWAQLQNRLREKPRFDPKFTRFRNFYVGGAHLCPLDKQGRVLIPPRLRDYAALKKDVVLVGDVDMFRIWDRDLHGSMFLDGEQVMINDPGFLSTI